MTAVLTGGQICPIYAENVDPVRYFERENKGVSAARNLGIEKARGEWLTFVDADDFVGKDLFKNLLRLIEEYPDVDMVQCGCRNLFSDGSSTIEQQYKEIITQDRSEILNSVRGLTPCIKIYRKTIIDRFNIRFDEQMLMSEDLAFILDYVIHIKTLALSSETHSYYRRHDKSATQIKRILPYNTNLHGFRHLYDSTQIYFIQNEIRAKDCKFRQKLLSQFLWTTIASLYYNKMAHKERIFRLKEDFKKDEFILFKSNSFNKIKQAIVILIVLKKYKIFDIVFYIYLSKAKDL